MSALAGSFGPADSAGLATCLSGAAERAKVPRMRSSLFVVSLLLVACGASPASPDSPTSTPSAAPAVDAPGSDGRCLASMNKAPPKAAIEEVGTVVVHPGTVCSLEVRAKDGSAKPAPPCDPKHARDAILLAGCAVGGDALWPTDPNASEKAERIELKVGRYTHPDPKADLALICAPFATLKNPRTGRSIEEDIQGLDDSQRARIRAEVLEETMTSREWRLWLHGFLENREAAIAKLREAAKAADLTCASEWTKK